MSNDWLTSIRRWWHAWREPDIESQPESLGKRGEQLAAKFLRKQGYKILLESARNKIGELDVVALDGRTIVFVEVKTRRSTDAGHPAEAVDQRKQAKITHVALAFLKRRRLLEHSTRFDVIAITWPGGHTEPVIEHYKNAFEATGRDSMYS